MSDAERLVADYPSPTKEKLEAEGRLKSPTLHPSTQAMLDQVSKRGGLGDAISVGYARRRFRGITPLIASYPDVASVTDRTIAGPQGSIPIRIIRADDDSSDRPVIIWFPGGGYVLGDLETAEPTARQLAVSTGAVVVCVDYRKAPEHRLDDAYDDALAVVRWVHANARNIHVDRDRIIVGGDSAGGNIAAVVALELTRAKNPGPRIALQLLLYPAVSVEHDPSRSGDDDGTLNNSALTWFEIHVAGSVDPRSTRYYPMAIRDVSGLPPAVIVTCGWDPLRDEAITYLDRLREAGVRAEHLHYADEVHGFMTMDLMLEQATPALQQVADLTREILELPDFLLPDEMPVNPVEAKAERVFRRASVIVREAAEHLNYKMLRRQRRTLQLLGLPAGRDIERVNSQLLRLELQVRALRKALDEQQDPSD